MWTSAMSTGIRAVLAPLLASAVILTLAPRRKQIQLTPTPLWFRFPATPPQHQKNCLLQPRQAPFRSLRAHPQQLQNQKVCLLQTATCHLTEMRVSRGGNLHCPLATKDLLSPQVHRDYRNCRLIRRISRRHSSRNDTVDFFDNFT